VTLVGFGSQGTIPAFEQNDFQRHQDEATMQEINHNSRVGSQSVQLTNRPGEGSGVGAARFGDSGGPAFYKDPSSGEETTIVTSVTIFRLLRPARRARRQFPHGHRGCARFR
jgi:hypothetical protein